MVVEVGGPKSNAVVDDGDRSVKLLIPDQQPNGDGGAANIENWGSSVFEPQPVRREPSDPKDIHGDGDPPSPSSSSSSSSSAHAPEKKLTLFALRLAILEKAASGLGALGFIWATVVLLGGFAITLDKTDFWVVTVILLIEGARIFSRSHELEWQHQSWTFADAGRVGERVVRSTSRFLRWSFSFLLPRGGGGGGNESHGGGVRSPVARRTGRPIRASTETKRTWKSSDVPLLPYAGWIFISRNTGRLLYGLQVASAIACVSLSLLRLIQQDYGDVAKGDTDKRNRKAALNLFYGTALAEAAMFLAEKIYWEWKISFGKLLEQVNRECGFSPSTVVCVRRFFYDCYSRCINGSIFDGLQMDLVSFAQELLASDSHDEQLIGARVLQSFANSRSFADAALRKIGTSTAVMERLLEMLNWKDPTEEEIRRAAAEIVSKLAGKKRNALRVAGIPGAMESISSLLYVAGRSDVDASKPHEISGRQCLAGDREDNHYIVFNLLGLLILKKLAQDHGNCGKIGGTRGLLDKIIDFTANGEHLLRGDRATDSQIRAMKRSLQLVKLLAAATGQTGEQLRREISEIIFTISNIREILHHGGDHTMLQKLGIEILTSLAMDGDANERVGSTGGILAELLSIFLSPAGVTEAQGSVRVEAGEALAMLALGSEANCERMMRKGMMVSLVGALQEPVLRVHAARILRNLCAYAGVGCYDHLRGISAATPTVLKCITVGEQKLLEVSIGLAVQIFHLTGEEERAEGFEDAGITEHGLAERLVCTLRRYNRPFLNVPRLRRFVVELAIQMMRGNPENIRWFGRHQLAAQLQSVAETTSELECYNVFSGSVGLRRHRTSVASLVDEAAGLLALGRER